MQDSPIRMIIKISYLEYYSNIEDILENHFYKIFFINFDHTFITTFFAE